MKGHILDFSVQTNSGVISGDDNRQYAFQGQDWMEADLLRLGMRVDFAMDGDQAIKIYAVAPVNGAGEVVATLASGQGQFDVRNTVLADVRVRFELETTRFDLPCTIVEKLAPKPVVSIEYNSQDECMIDDEKMHKLWRAMMDSTKISAIITDGTTSLKAELFAGNFPQFWFSFSGQPFRADFYISKIVNQAISFASITEINFNIINMTTLHNFGHTIVFNGGWQRIGGAILQNDEWTFCIRQHPNHSDAQKYLRTIGGFQITHIGSLYKTDGSAFSQDEVVSQLTAIRTFLSFANGARVGVTRMSGVNQDWTTVWSYWNISIADWSDGSRSFSWFNRQDGANTDEPMVLSELFLEFCRLVKSDTSINRTIEWYLTANTMRPFIQTESNRISGDIASINLAHNAHNDPWNKLNIDLKNAGIYLDIPIECSNLQQLYHANPKWAEPTRPSGPVVLRHLRNCFEHPTKPVKGLKDDYATAAMYEAWHLGQWYLESLILHKCGYTGPRANRVKGGIWETPGKPPSSHT